MKLIVTPDPSHITDYKEVNRMDEEVTTENAANEVEAQKQRSQGVYSVDFGTTKICQTDDAIYLSVQ